MDHIIEELINIENRATQYIQDSEDAKKDLPRRIASQIDALTKAINNDTRQKIEKLNADAKSELTSKLNEIDTKTNNTLRILERDFEINREKWEDELFNKIVGIEVK